MTLSPELKHYNTGVFEQLRNEYDHFQIGFFKGTDILFIGQNPGVPYDVKGMKDTAETQAQTTLESFEEHYFELIKSSKLGQYLGPTIDEEWDRVSFTNVVKIATPANSSPSKILYEMFFPILMQQIDLLQPKLIACLGKYAGSVFALDEFYYAKKYDKSVVCMYPHPAYVQRGGRDAVINEQVRMKLSIEELQRYV